MCTFPEHVHINGVELYVETGPKNILKGLNRRITKNKTINFNEF